MRYFFDLYDGRLTVKDPQGTGLPNDDAAQELAISALANIVRFMIGDPAISEMTSTVRDETGRVVFNFKLTQIQS